MNIVMNEHQEFIEVQGTAENQSFNEQQLQAMLKLAKEGIAEIIKLQKATVS